MARDREARVRSNLKRIAAQFIQEKAGSQSLVTVTGIELASDFKRARILITVYPAEREREALEFLLRRRGELKQYARTHAPMKHITNFDFGIDEGEKNRQKIERMIEEDKREQRRKGGSGSE